MQLIDRLRSLLHPTGPSQAGLPEPPFQANARQFAANESGSGIFGRWILDGDGLPAYRYEIDQYRDRRAAYPNSEGLDRRDHWHLFGNDRVNVLASNDGTVQVYLGDRGGVWLNWIPPHEASLSAPLRAIRWIVRLGSQIVQWFARRRAGRQALIPPRGTSLIQPQTPVREAPRDRKATLHAYGGGFSYVDDGERVWATAFRYRPEGATVERIFGMGYFETATTYRGLRVTRRVHAPSGDDPLVLADVEIRNLRVSPVQLRHYEYWDANVHQLRLQWFRTGLFAPFGDSERQAINAQFAPSITWEPDDQVLRFHQQPPAHCPRPEAVDLVDWYPADVILASLCGPAAGCYTDRLAFFGNGGPGCPEAVARRWNGVMGAPSTSAMPYCLVLRHDLEVAAGETASLRFAYGAIRPEADGCWRRYREGDPLADSRNRRRESLAYFRTPGEDALQREMAWHAYSLLAATTYNAYLATHVTPQGSAYLYLHGADGAPRDQALFCLPLTYLRPELARENLRLLMSLMSAETGGMPYAFTGFGAQDGATIHTNPSDLDLFFLLGLGEYLAATGDLAFLSEDVPFYPQGKRPVGVGGSTVLDHVQVSVGHLLNEIGFGEHGLLRIGDGDWSDAIVCETALRDGPLGVRFENSREHGESIPNSQMALYVLPLMADLLEPVAGVLAERLRAVLPGLRAAVQQFWAGNWYARAVLRDQANRPVVIDRDHINLEAQIWALIGGQAEVQGVQADLIAAVLDRLDEPSPIGAMLREKGMVWPAIGQLLTWGYSLYRPDLAWASLKKQTFAAHAEAFPAVWTGIWTGPDGFNGKQMPDPGGTWASPITPMTDFPMANANPHAMALLGLLRVCGVRPVADGLILAPQAPPQAFVLDLPLLRLEVEPGRIGGEYRAIVDGSRALHVRVPAGAIDLTASLNGQGAAIEHGPATGVLPADEVLLRLQFAAGQVIPFEVRWNAAG